MTVLLLVDLPNLARKAFHIHGGRFHGSDGQPTGTAYGVLSSTLAIARVAGATHVAGAIEGGGTAARREIDPAYKRQRKPSPDGFHDEFVIALQSYAAMGWPVYAAAGYEADDVLATLARQAIECSVTRVEVASADRDLFGVVTDRVGVLWTGAPTREIDQHRIDVAAVRARLGVDPTQVADYKAIAGDASDGYGGVRGIGPETAARLVSRYGSIEAIYRDLETIEPVSLRNKLRAGADDAQRSKALARLRHEAPVTPAFDPSVGPLAPGDRDRALHYLRQAAMGSLLSRLPGA